MTQQNALIWKNGNVVAGDDSGAKAEYRVFQQLSSRAWTSEQIPLIQVMWDCYQEAIDNFDYQVKEYGYNDPECLVWACGKVFGARTP